MGKSTQNTKTPTDFMEAVKDYFGIQFKYDMAASTDNAQAKYYYREEEDSLSIDWPVRDWCWLNPPFHNLTKWINKCKEQMDRGCRIVSIWPLSGDLNQIPVWQCSEVYVIHGRIWPLVRGCMVCIWDKEFSPKGVKGLRWADGCLTWEW